MKHYNIHSFVHEVSRCVARLGLFALILGLSITTLSAHADLLENAGREITGGATKSPGTIVGEIIQIALGFLGIVFVILTIYAGFLYMTSQGDPEKAKKARALLINAIIGVGIVISAWAITYFVLTSLTSSIGT